VKVNNKQVTIPNKL